MPDRTSNVARETPRKRRNALIDAKLRKLMIEVDADMREEMRAEAEEQEFDRQVKLRHLKKKKKKKDAGAFRGGDPARMGRELLRLQTEGMKKVPPRFKLIIPPAH
jgi:hypothetical protein